MTLPDPVFLKASEDYEPREIKKKPLTVVQKRTLTAMRAGAVLARHSDVWRGGYWYTLGETEVRQQTVQALRNTGMIAVSETARVYSGRHYTPYRLTEASPT